MHRLLYRSGLTFEQAKADIATLADTAPAAADDVALMSRFIAAATRGIAR